MPERTFFFMHLEDAIARLLTHMDSTTLLSLVISAVEFGQDPKLNYDKAFLGALWPVVTKVNLIVSGSTRFEFI